MLYLLVIILLFASLLLLRLRLRLVVTPEERLLFVGLGRSGFEIDFLTRQGCLKVAGMRVRTFELQSKRREEEKRVPEPETSEPVEKRGRPDWREIVGVLADSRHAVWQFVRGVFRSVIVEELYGEIRGGFARPDVTGIVYGQYCAIMASVPRMSRHFKFEPDWTGERLEGTVRLSLALPLYRGLWQVMVLLYHLPVRRMRALAVRREEGVTHA